ncbi:DUF4236 domain-containing protein [uncultured Gemmiger sp.]|uniref:DUF4236 domain-containing protein n=1 Tax=uncultured Gemmiger sp. TaxID=1623490 RepID=UPI0025DD0DFD|nr:DUF4236 domain-containing protein [uncultured Gemmiger sp.]
MGFRFRKSIKIAPGVRLNLNSKSTSLSFGGKGARYTVSSTGRKTATVGIPGTGISYSETTGGHRASGTGRKKLPPSSGAGSPAARTGSTPPPNGDTKGGCSTGCLMLLAALILWPFALSYWLWKTDKLHWDKKVRVGAIAVLWVVLFAIYGVCKENQQTPQLPVISTAETAEAAETAETAETAASPTPSPSAEPTATPTATPTPAPTKDPTEDPTQVPTETPEPTQAPTPEPTEAPQAAVAPVQETVNNGSEGNFSGGAAETVDNSDAYQPDMVYIASSGKGKKYHSNPNCSQMDGATAVTKEQAEAWGYTPCKRCY